MLVSRDDLMLLLPLSPLRAAVGSYWRHVALRTRGDGWRTAGAGEVIRGPRARGEWTVYRPAKGGRWGRSAVVGIGDPPANVVEVDVGAIRTHADALTARVRLRWPELGAADLEARRISGVWTVLRAGTDPTGRPVSAWWASPRRGVWGLRAGVVGGGTHAANRADWRQARRQLAESRAAAAAADEEWVTRESLRAAGACDAGISAAMPAVARALGLPDLEGVGAVRAEVVKRVRPQWAHATRR